MGQTMVEKIVSRAVGRPVRAGEKIDRLPITKLFFNDVIGPPAIPMFWATLPPARPPEPPIEPASRSECFWPWVRGPP